MAVEMTEREVFELAELAQLSPEYKTGDLIGKRPAFSSALAGMDMALKADNGGPEIKYRFVDAHKMLWDDGAGEREEYYEALQIDKAVYLVAYLQKNSRPVTSCSIVLDLEMNLQTMIISPLGASPLSARYVEQRVYHGYIEREGAPRPVAWRHQPTRDLSGHSMGWSYRDDMTSQHIFGSPYSIAWVILQGPGSGLLGCAPAKYFRIKEHVYLYTWVETFGSGQQGVVLMNKKIMHDVGTFYGITHGQRFEFYTYGARGYDLGAYDVARFFKW
jgi:hypothetical protein